MTGLNLVYDLVKQIAAKTAAKVIADANLLTDFEATVTGLSPLRIQPDKSSSPLPVTPAKVLVPALNVNDRVWCLWRGTSIIVVGVIQEA